MTAEEWRDIGHARWRDSLAPLEDVKGPAFRAAVSRERILWSKTVASHVTDADEWEKDFTELQDIAYPETFRHASIVQKWHSLTVHTQDGSAGFTTNVWIVKEGKVVWSKKELSGFGVDPTSWHFYVLEDTGAGAEHLELRVYKWNPTNNMASLCWKKAPVGPSVVLCGRHILYMGVENALRYHEIWKADIDSGENAVRLFKEPDPRIQLDILKRGNITFVHSANALFQRLGVVRMSGMSGSIQWLTNTVKSTLVPISSNMYASDKAIHTRRGRIPLPENEHIVDARDRFVTTVCNGRASLWLLQGTSLIPLLRLTEISKIEIVQEDTLRPTFLVMRPHIPLTTYEFQEGIGLVQIHQYPAPVQLYPIHQGFAQSADGTKVPYMVVSATTCPTKMVVEGYGAYGMLIRRGYPLRWLPWLKRGYAFVMTCPRGGRENGDPWYDGGRTALRKHHTFEDTAAVIQEVQARLKISPQRTIFFGRSAGGWLAARIAQNYGHLVQAVYAEVPYVDVLRTTTNPDLPLTRLEYDEFGDPIHRPEEFSALKKISPIDTIPVCRSKDKCPTIIIRTGVNDMQVLPYESLKWAARLREKGWNRVFVGVDEEGGHFAKPNVMCRQRAEDAVLLTNALQKDKARSASTRRSTRSVGIAGKTRRRRFTNS
jgi:cephalosporin-C deacetylase-like acetyl esterase